MPSKTSATTAARTMRFVRERRSSSSSSDIRAASRFLQARMALLAFEAALLGCARRPGGSALLGDHGGLADQLDVPRADIGAVALLRAVLAAGDHQHAVLG